MEREGLRPQVLNAKNHLKEAEIIAQAGKPGAITIATNMAGRGVDIILGGLEKETGPSSRSAGSGQEEVKALGGLHVIGTERHESRRIDNQLRGRAGRQGDPGSSQFYVSTEDDLMRIFGGDRMQSLMKTLRLPEDMPIENRIISKSIESAQTKVEGNNFDVRKHLVEYDDVINKHRESIYTKRKRILQPSESVINKDDDTKPESKITNDPSLDKRSGAGKLQITNKTQNPNDQNGKDEVNESGLLDNIILEMVENEIEQVVGFHTASDDIKAWNLEEIYETITTIFPVEKKLKQDISIYTDDTAKLGKAKARTEIIEHLVELAKTKYAQMQKQFKEAMGEDVPWREITKGILIRAIDTLWIEHLEAMAHMRQGIGLRGYGQQDPLVEYKKEAFRLYSELNSLIQKQVVYSIFKVSDMGQFKAPNLADRAKNFQAPAKTMEANSSPMFKSGNSENKQDMVQAKAKDETGKKVGRNDPCPCGSGKKYKKCHGR